MLEQEQSDRDKGQYIHYRMNLAASAYHQVHAEFRDGGQRTLKKD